ncbi:hypothetical protein K491DRAFT_720420 [Lophiostoma macrostomum CBS 122681]|uniref:Exonuclease domain-containing protein n=1 Tax=Lophiostoma macrostomum CBS 122681 TaxID=1314788 RepID=A0A6A6SV23_9PLEO|nr:hypothetical protein K491DRAFT_720420 [Lophiostoma macrostomum CBS 122681]
MSQLTKGRIETGNLSPVQWSIPLYNPRRQETINQIRELKEWVVKPANLTWFIDVEGVNLPLPYAPVPFQVAIIDRNSDSESPILNAVVAYQVDRLNLARTITQHGGSGDITAGTLRKVQSLATTTPALTPSEMHDALRHFNFDRNTHLVIAWGSSRIDEYSLTQILKREDIIIIRKSDIPINFKTFNLRALIQRITDLPITPLDYVFSRLCPNLEVPIWHRADADTYALRETFNRMVGQLDEMKGQDEDEDMYVD